MARSRLSRVPPKPGARILAALLVVNPGSAVGASQAAPSKQWDQALGVGSRPLGSRKCCRARECLADMHAGVLKRHDARRAGPSPSRSGTATSWAACRPPTSRSRPYRRTTTSIGSGTLIARRDSRRIRTSGSVRREGETPADLDDARSAVILSPFGISPGHEGFLRLRHVAYVMLCARLRRVASGIRCKRDGRGSGSW